jgi:ribosome-binding factor A
MDRLTQQFQQEIALIIHREIKDPRIGFVTVTGITLSKDLTHARVSYSCLGEEDDRTRSQEVLESSARFIRELLKKRLHLKAIPELTFRYDESIAGSIALLDTLDRIKRQDAP